MKSLLIYSPDEKRLLRGVQWIRVLKKNENISVSEVLGFYSTREEAYKDSAVGGVIASINDYSITRAVITLDKETAKPTPTKEVKVVTPIESPSVDELPDLKLAIEREPSFGRRTSALPRSTIVGTSAFVWHIAETVKGTRAEITELLIKKGVNKSTAQQELTYWQKADDLCRARFEAAGIPYEGIRHE